MDSIRHSRRAPFGTAMIGLLAICGMALPLYQGPLPASLPEGSIWGPLAVAATLSPLLFRRYGAAVSAGEIALRRGWGTETFELREVARIEVAPWAKKPDLHLILRGGGVRRIPAMGEDMARAFLKDAGKAGIVVIRL